MWEPTKDLPMYKDKPYSYASSRRKPPTHLQPRYLIGGVLTFLALLWFWGIFSHPISHWARDSRPSADKWDARRESVRDAFKKSWDGYEKYAWGKDEYHPVSKSGSQMAPQGMGWIIVDALDTLMIMNLTSRLSHARSWISTSLDYSQDQNVNTFETTIRMLGGLLSAHYLSTELPDMALLSEDGLGAVGEDLYLEKAADLAGRLLGAFSSESGVPYASVNMKTRLGILSHTDGGASSTAEATTLQLELKYLANLMGEKSYWEVAETVMRVVDDNGARDGLVPIFLYANSGEFRENNIRLGSRGDSYYGMWIFGRGRTSLTALRILD